MGRLRFIPVHSGPKHVGRSPATFADDLTPHHTRRSRRKDRQKPVLLTGKPTVKPVYRKVNRNSSKLQTLERTWGGTLGDRRPRLSQRQIQPGFPRFEDMGPLQIHAKQNGDCGVQTGSRRDAGHDMWLVPC